MTAEEVLKEMLSAGSRHQRSHAQACTLLGVEPIRPTFALTFLASVLWFFRLVYKVFTEALTLRAVADEAPIDENTCESPSRLRAARSTRPARSISIPHEAQLLNRIALPAAEAYFPHSWIAFWRFTRDESLSPMRR